MAQSFTFTTTTPRQEAALAYAASQANQSVDDYLRARFADVLADAIGRFNQARGAALATAYANATPQQRAAIDATLGLS